MLFRSGFPNWKSSLVLVKPETVIGWHKKAFKLFWSIKSRKPGRPRISAETIALIRKIHNENPLLSPENIFERSVDLAITNVPAPNTIAKYIHNIRKTPTEKQKQSWKIFLENHRNGIWAMDFLVVPTINFKVVVCLTYYKPRQIKPFKIS